MPRDGAIIFGDLITKLDMLNVACDKCGRKGRYAVPRLIEQRGRDAKVHGRDAWLLLGGCRLKRSF
jgi:hypothetical protein